MIEVLNGSLVARLLALDLRGGDDVVTPVHALRGEGLFVTRDALCPKAVLLDRALEVAVAILAQMVVVAVVVVVVVTVVCARVWRGRGLIQGMQDVTVRRTIASGCARGRLGNFWKRAEGGRQT